MRNVMVKKTYIALGLFAAIALTCAAGLSQVSANEPVAVISAVSGIVHCKSGASRIWKKCGGNEQLYENDNVKTSGGSTAFINFPDGSYIKLLPLSRATITKPWGDNPSTLVAVDSGRIWVKMDTKDDDGMFLVKTPDGIVRGNNSRAFVEVDQNNKSCIEVASGVAGVISATTPDSEIFLKNKQKIALAAGSIIGTPESVDIFVDETIDSKSCFATPEQKEEAAAAATPAQGATYASIEESDGETYVVVTTTTTVVVEGIENGDTIEDNSGIIFQSPPTDDISALQPEEEIYLTIFDTSIIEFIPIPTETEIPLDTNPILPPYPEPTQENPQEQEEPQPETDETGPCEESPVFFDVTVSDEEAEDTGEVILDSELPCDLNATATIVWNTSVECGSIKSTSVGEANKPPVFFNGAGPGQVAGGKLDYAIKDAKPHEMIIKSEADNGKITFYSFTVKVQGQTSSALPEISGVTINNVEVDEDSTYHLGSTSCGDMPFEIKGTATSECGDIKEVELEVDGTDVLVKGKDSWAYSKKFNEDDTFPVVVRASDSSGRTSRDYEIEIELVREITPPYVSIETIGGEEPITSSGEPMALYRNNLESGKLIVKGSVESTYCSITKIEASADEGSSWISAAAGAKWEFPFTPSDETEYQIMVRATDEAGQESDEMTPLEIIYFKYTLLEKLEMTFKDMMDWYVSENDDDFMEYVLDSFTSTAEDDSVKSRSNLEQALQNKFDEQQAIYLNYQTPSYSISGTYGYVLFSWNAHPASDNNYWHSANFIFSKTGYGWKLVKVDDKDTFLRHTSKTAFLEIQNGYMTSLEANREDTTDIEVMARDSAYNPVKDGTLIKFTATTGTVTSPEMTDEGLAEATYTSGSSQGTAMITVSATEGPATSQKAYIEQLPEAPPGPPTN